MGDSFKKVQAGDKLRIPAAAYNAFIDSALDLRARRQNQGRTPQAVYRTSGIVLVKNASGADQDRFAVLGIDAPIYTPEDNLDSFKNKVALVGVMPQVAEHLGRFVVLAEPLKAGAIGMAYAAGVCPVQINIPDLEKTYPYADVGDGITSGLEATMRGGACILWNQPPLAPGSVWAIVRIDGLPAASSSTDQLNFDCYFRHRSHFADPIIVDSNDWRGRLLLVGGAYGPVDGNPNPGWVTIHNLRIRTAISPAMDTVLLRQGSANSLLQLRVDRTSGQLYLYSEAWNSVNTHHHFSVVAFAPPKAEPELEG